MSVFVHYFALIQEHHDKRDGLWSANATALIPLKAHAWLNLTKAKAADEPIDSQTIKKHRSDVFRLAATLPGEPGPELAASIVGDIAHFLDSFTLSSEEWPAIIASLESTIRAKLQPPTLLSAIQTYFRIM